MIGLQERRDTGLSLIELIIVVLLIGILGSAAAMILVNSWRTQDTVMSTTQATNRGQLVGQSIEKAARNADAIVISSDGRYVGFRVKHTSGSYTCAAFMVRAGSPADSLVSSASAPVLLAGATNWPQPWLSGNVRTHGSTPYFAQSTVAGVPVIVYTFDIVTKAAPVAISGQVSARGQGTIVSTNASPQGASPCWN